MVFILGRVAAWLTIHKLRADHVQAWHRGLPLPPAPEIILHALRQFLRTHEREKPPGLCLERLSVCFMPAPAIRATPTEIATPISAGVLFTCNHRACSRRGRGASVTVREGMLNS